MDETSFQPGEILAALERHRVRYVVIGGLAATLHGSPVMRDLDLSFIPSGTTGFADLHQHAVAMSLMGRPVAVASLADVIRSKEAANRPKDQLTLPALRLLLQRVKAEGGDR